MPSSEHERNRNPEDHRGREREPMPYYRAARFTDEEQSRAVYDHVQDLIAADACDLSTYRFQRGPHDPVWHVAVLGSAPPPELDQSIAAALGVGEAEALPPALFAFLLQRRAQATRLAPWVERHTRSTPPHNAGSSEV